ncbi:hypothetical protein PAAL109150_09930 [Paenibacillus alkaliterrae]
MPHPDESGNIQQYKVTLRDTFRAHLTALIIRILNWDAERWYKKYGNR